MPRITRYNIPSGNWKLYRASKATMMIESDVDFTLETLGGNINGMAGDFIAVDDGQGNLSCIPADFHAATYMCIETKKDITMCNDETLLDRAIFLLDNIYTSHRLDDIIYQSDIGAFLREVREQAASEDREPTAEEKREMFRDANARDWGEE